MPELPVNILDYSNDPKTLTDRRYAIMLVVLALLYGFSVVLLLFLPLAPASPPLDPTIKWVPRFCAAYCGLIVLLILATLLARAKTRSNACLIWTKAFNIFRLIVFPFGIIVGIYGLWKIDKLPRAALPP